MASEKSASDSAKKFCKGCAQQFEEDDMIKSGRAFYCKDCAADELSKGTTSPNIQINNTQSLSGNQEFSNGRKIVDKDWTVALILSVLFGWLGADRFYVNQIGLGFLKLITFGGWGLWWLIDVILFATKNIKYVRWD